MAGELREALETESKHNQLAFTEIKHSTCENYYNPCTQLDDNVL